MPTVSAAQALQDLRSSDRRCIETGLRALDEAMGNGEAGERGGVPRGKVTEIWGPSGVGKTGLG